MFDEILSKIEKQTSLPRGELIERVDQKYEELDGLITREGAAYLVARDLGINLPSSTRRLEMKNIIPGMKNINVSGRIFKISQINEFERSDGSKGKVVNITVSDGTGSVRVPLWNDQVDLIGSESIKLGDTIQITNGLSRENTFGDIEISLGKFGGIRQIEDIGELPSLRELTERFFNVFSERVMLKDIVPGNFEIKATIVHVFSGKFLFNICPMCSSSLDGDKCTEHGVIEPNYGLVISCIADDDTSDLRIVFFRELAENLCSTTSKELSLLDMDERYKLIKEKILGRELIISGRIRNNRFSDGLEMMASSFKDINVLEESKKLAEAIEIRLGG
jgi:replication factor A1